MPGRAGRPETGHRIPLDPTAGAGCLLRRRRLGPREAGEAPRERTGARAMRAEPVPRLAEKLNRLRPRHQRGAGRRGATAPRTQPPRWRGGSGGVGPFAPPPPPPLPNAGGALAPRWAGPLRDPSPGKARSPSCSRPRRAPWGLGSPRRDRRLGRREGRRQRLRRGFPWKRPRAAGRAIPAVGWVKCRGILWANRVRRRARRARASQSCPAPPLGAGFSTYALGASSSRGPSPL